MPGKAAGKINETLRGKPVVFHKYICTAPLFWFHGPGIDVKISKSDAVFRLKPLPDILCGMQGLSAAGSAGIKTDHKIMIPPVLIL